MALDFAQTSASLSWQQSQTNTPFTKTSQGPDAVSSNFVWTTGAGDANAVLTYSQTIAASGDYDLELQNGTDLLNLPVVLTRVYAIQIQPDGADVIVKPSAVDGLQWFFGNLNDTITVPDGGIFNYSNPLPTTVDATHKKINIENASGANPVVVKIAIIGGT